MIDHNDPERCPNIHEGHDAAEQERIIERQRDTRPDLYTVRQLMRDLRSGPYTSIGSYPTFFYTTHGETISHEGLRAEIWDYARATRDGKRYGDAMPIAGFDVNWEDPGLMCDETGERIPSAYAED